MLKINFFIKSKGFILKLMLGEISCDFNEGSMCSGWTFEQNSTIYAANWTIWKGATLTANTGPQRDHFKKDGFYIFMETTSKKHRDIAMFYSPIIEQIQTDQVVNVTFWYYMHGIFIQSLKVYVFPGNGDQQLVKAINNEQGKQWKQAVAYLEHMGPFKIGFQAMVGSAVSDIAVDDITITGAEIYPRSTTIETSTSLKKEKRLNENETEDFFPFTIYNHMCHRRCFVGRYSLSFMLLCTPRKSTSEFQKDCGVQHFTTHL
ncbi:unnamed protein product [Mytilus edulis]|uniref:MAM domain-containing protein n=1 Tax=Mytilus edulis TaxID=6550 RepID=A0A8S3SDK7_MYTED|nr:unnamed protein product [Mytilus edulis]